MGHFPQSNRVYQQNGTAHKMARRFQLESFNFQRQRIWIIHCLCKNQIRTQKGPTVPFRESQWKVSIISQISTRPDISLIVSNLPVQSRSNDHSPQCCVTNSQIRPIRQALFNQIRGKRQYYRLTLRAKRGCAINTFVTDGNKITLTQIYVRQHAGHMCHVLAQTKNESRITFPQLNSKFFHLSLVSREPAVKFHR